MNNIDSIALGQEKLGCPTLVHQTVCVQGTVTITPNIDIGLSKSLCIGNPVIGGCPGKLVETCSFTVGQNICVEIPLRFAATATAVSDGLICDTPRIGPCPDEPEPPTGCTYTIGYYKNHSKFTNVLITAAGGSILLGNGGGLSYTVSTANANGVFDFNVPSPPAPSSPPFRNQYQVLYAQLLAAKLNVLRLVQMGAKVCSYATDAIAMADEFLSDSPPGGMAGAPSIQERLAMFNEGEAPGCPPSCS